MIVYFKLKKGCVGRMQCLSEDCYFCPCERCTRYADGYTRVNAETLEAISQIDDGLRRGRIEIVGIVKPLTMDEIIKFDDGLRVGVVEVKR